MSWKGKYTFYPCFFLEKTLYRESRIEFCVRWRVYEDTGIRRTRNKTQPWMQELASSHCSRRSPPASHSERDRLRAGPGAPPRPAGRWSRWRSPPGRRCRAGPSSGCRWSPSAAAARPGPSPWWHPRCSSRCEPTQIEEYIGYYRFIFPVKIMVLW